MSDFEFVSVILSIVIGLGITRVLSGLAATIRHRDTLSAYGLCAAWASLVLLLQVLFWLGTVNSYRRPDAVFTVADFGTLFLMAIALYFAAALILPGRIESETDLGQHFGAVRRPFFLVLGAYPVLELLDSAKNGIDNLIGLGPAYVGIQAISVVVCAIGFSTGSRRVQSTLVVGYLLGATGWLVAKLWVI